MFGFLISAIVQVVFSRGALHRHLGPNLRGVTNGTLFGIVASACSYGAAAAARGMYQRGADVRALFAFLISSTNMNVAILILFWTMVGWKFAFAEFFGGIIIIAIVTAGISLLFSAGELERLRADAQGPASGAIVAECPLCGMEGEPEHAVVFEGTTYLACGARHEAALREDPARSLAESGSGGGLAALRSPSTWRAVVNTALGDVAMLRTELIVGYVVAGFAAALVPPQWLSSALHAVGAVPFVGYVLLLALGLVLAVATFVCSMGNVPIARFLALAGIPLGANTTFIYGDLLVPPLVAIYRKSFPPKVTWSFVGLFVLGAMLAGAVMDLAIGDLLGGLATGSMEPSMRFTTISNALAILALLVVAALANHGKESSRLAKN